MNWSGAKSILIIFFLIINIIFLGILINTDRSIYTVDAKILNSTTEILKKSQITVSDSVIPKKNPHMKYAEAYNVITDNMLFAQKLLGGNVFESDGVYSGDAGKLTVSGDSFSIHYYSGDYFGISECAGIKKQARRILRKLDFPNTGNYDITEENGGYRIDVHNIIDGKNFFDSQLCITINENRVENISGTWFETETNMLGSDDIKSVTTALIDFMHGSVDTPTEITNIDIGYYKGEPDVYHRSAVLIPAWKITESSGKITFIDARSNSR